MSVTDQGRTVPAVPAGGREEMRFRGGGFAVRPRAVVGVLSFALVLVVWEAAVRRGMVPALFLPAPSTVLRTLWQMAASGELWRHLGISMLRLVAGWILGTLAGLALGLAIGLWSNARAVGIPFVAAIFPIPKIALMPLLIVWLGIGEAPKILTLVMGVGFPTAITVYSAIDATPRNLIRMAQSFNVPYWAVVWKVLLPGALGAIVAGFRISTSMALVLLVAAEMLGAQYGLGAFLLGAGNMMLTERLLAGVVCLSVLGLLVSWAISVLERRLTHWR